MQDISSKKLRPRQMRKLLEQMMGSGMNHESPFQPHVDMEENLRQISGLKDMVLTPTASGKIPTALAQVSRAATNMLVENLRDGQMVVIGVGQTVSSVGIALQPERIFMVIVVPMTNGVQRPHHTRINHLTAQMAERLGGKALQMPAPGFAKSVELKNMLISVAIAAGSTDSSEESVEKMAQS